MASLAVVLTCYNRKQATLRCLGELFKAELPPSTTLEVYLVDDSSPDGTGAAVRESFPSVNLLRGSGKLYWGGGMRLAFGEAIRANHDFFLWLNDDVELFRNSIASLMSTYLKIATRDDGAAIVVGATCDQKNGKLTYSGRERSAWHPLRFELVKPDPNVPVPCDTMNGNIVLIPNTVARRVGNIDYSFTQRIGDIDYGLRARRAGVSIWVCPGFVGHCESHISEVPWKSSRYALRARIAMMNSPLGLPFVEYMLFAYRHAGVLGGLLALIGYRKVIFPDSNT